MVFREMVFTVRFKRNFAFVSCALSALHFVLETAYTIFVGQSFLGYLPDCIADVLLLAGAYMLLKHPHATGMICGAWGFTFCLHYRTWAWRFEDYMVGTLNQVQTGIMYVLAATMIISLLCFAISLAMSMPPNARHGD